jgi:hypothetical protein
MGTIYRERVPKLKGRSEIELNKSRGTYSSLIPFSIGIVMLMLIKYRNHAKAERGKPG